MHEHVLKASPIPRRRPSVVSVAWHPRKWQSSYLEQLNVLMEGTSLGLCQPYSKFEDGPVDFDIVIDIDDGSLAPSCSKPSRRKISCFTHEHFASFVFPSVFRGKAEPRQRLNQLALPDFITCVNATDAILPTDLHGDSERKLLTSCPPKETHLIPGIPMCPTHLSYF